jgi:hypothetical protein
VLYQMLFEVVARLAFIIDAAVGIESHAAEQPNTFLGSNITQPFRGVETAVAVAQKAPDNDGVNVVPTAPLKQGCVVGDERLGRAAVFVAGSDRVRAGPIERPFGAMVPGPKHTSLDGGFRSSGGRSRNIGSGSRVR